MAEVDFRMQFDPSMSSEGTPCVAVTMGADSGVIQIRFNIPLVNVPEFLKSFRIGVEQVVEAYASIRLEQE